MVCCRNSVLQKLQINGQSYTKCVSCGLLQKANFNLPLKEKERYEKHVYDSAYKDYMLKIFKKIKPYLSGITCLDYGCGREKTLATILNESGYLADSYDLYFHPEYPLKKYDNVILIEVFEHLHDPYSELLSIKELLRENGKIIIMTKPYDGVDLNFWWYLRDITHYTFMQRNTLKHWDLGLDLQVEGDIFILRCI